MFCEDGLLQHSFHVTTVAHNQYTAAVVILPEKVPWTRLATFQRLLQQGDGCVIITRARCLLLQDLQGHHFIIELPEGPIRGSP